MADDRLPVMLQFLHISIAASGELAVSEDGPTVGVVASHDCSSVLRDSHGRTYLLFDERSASSATAASHSARRVWMRNGLIAAASGASVVAALAAALRWGIPVSPF